MPTPNGPLTAAIAALEAQPLPWFVPVYSIRLTDAAVYLSFVTTYGFGTPLIIGLSPADAEVLTGLTINSDPSYESQIVWPQIFVHPDAQNVLGVPISTSDSGGTIDITYSTPYGTFSQVIWRWQCDVQWQPEAVPLAVGSYNQQVVTWTGDGTTDGSKAVPTTLDLTQGAVAIWCGGWKAAGATQYNCFRTNAPDMLGTRLPGVTTLQTASGIMGFTSTGFTVADGSVGGQHFANQVDILYTAVVMQDTTSDRRYLRVGTYEGIGVFSIGVKTTAGSPYVTGSGFLTDWNDMTATDSTGSYGWTTLGPTLALLSSTYPNSLGTNFSFDGGNRSILTGGPIAVTHAWDWERLGVYRSLEMIDTRTALIAGSAAAPAPVGNRILSLSAAEPGFVIGTDSDVNGNGLLYAWVTLSVDAAFLAQQLFASFNGTGTATPPFHVTGLGFTPALVFVAYYPTAGFNSQSMVWRGGDQTGTISTNCNGGDIAAQGIAAIGAGSVDVGTTLAPDGGDFYGFAFAASGTVAGPSTPGPAYSPVTAVALAGAYVPSGALLTGVGFGNHQLGPCGCPGD